MPQMTLIANFAVQGNLLLAFFDYDPILHHRGRAMWFGSFAFILVHDLLILFLRCISVDGRVVVLRLYLIGGRLRTFGVFHLT